MKKYEIALVFKNVEETDLKKTIDGINKLINSKEGKVTKVIDWGKRKLAYRIKGETHGIYQFFKIEIAREKVTEIENGLKINEGLLRYLIVEDAGNIYESPEEREKYANSEKTTDGTTPTNVKNEKFEQE